MIVTMMARATVKSNAVGDCSRAEIRNDNKNKLQIFTYLFRTFAVT